MSVFGDRIGLTTGGRADWRIGVEHWQEGKPISDERARAGLGEPLQQLLKHETGGEDLTARFQLGGKQRYVCMTGRRVGA
jgi:hypothetical protein